ncbi:MAG TPA: PAS domain S-box protein [Pyrinomonadaceae bacterium]|jgi:PAS domain-containing protein
MAESSRTLMPDTQLFNDVFNASPIGIAVENLEGQPLFVNPAFCSFLGFGQEELRNKHCVDFSPREDAEKDWGAFSATKSRFHRSLPIGETLFPKRRLFGLGTLEHLFIEQSSISTRNRDGGGHYRQKEGRRSPVPTCRHCGVL